MDRTTLLIRKLVKGFTEAETDRFFSILAHLDLTYMPRDVDDEMYELFQLSHIETAAAAVVAERAQRAEKEAVERLFHAVASVVGYDE